jgi:hypothetical protein
VIYVAVPTPPGDQAPPPKRTLVVALTVSLIAAIAMAAALAFGRSAPCDPAPRETATDRASERDCTARHPAGHQPAREESDR